MLVGAPVIEEILHPPPRCLGNNAPTSAGTRPPAQVEGDPIGRCPNDPAVHRWSRIRRNL